MFQEQEWPEKYHELLIDNMNIANPVAANYTEELDQLFYLCNRAISLPAYQMNRMTIIYQKGRRIWGFIYSKENHPIGR